MTKRIIDDKEVEPGKVFNHCPLQGFEPLMQKLFCNHRLNNSHGYCTEDGCPLEIVKEA